MRKIIFILLFLPVLAFAYTLPGTPSGFVNDFTNTFSVDQKTALESKLKTFAAESSNEISVALIPNLGGDTIENFAVSLFKDWGIGKNKNDNGVLILVAKDDRQMRIEVGYGLEGALTDSQSNQIIANILRPAFRINDFYGGLNAATDAVVAATKGEYVPTVIPRDQGYTDDQILEIVFYSAFALMWLSSVLGRTKSWWLGGVLGGFVGIGIGLVYGFLFIGLVAMGLLIPFGLLFDYLTSRAYARHGHRVGSGWWFGGFGSGGRGGGGFGGFGGGSSGGGGASGDW